MAHNEEYDNDENDDNDIDLNNNVFSKFDSLPGMDSDSDNEPIVKKNNYNKPQQEPNNSKIIVKVCLNWTVFRNYLYLFFMVVQI